MVAALSADKSNVSLSVTDLHKSFGSHEVLKGVSLKACEGDVISLLGSSGSGKSTFLRCINLLETPTSGLITVQLIRDRLNASAPGWRWSSNPSTCGRT